MRIKCQDCKQIRETTSDPKTWPCPECDPAPTVTQSFTIDPYAVRTQFAQAARPTSTKEK